MTYLLLALAFLAVAATVAVVARRSTKPGVSWRALALAAVALLILTTVFDNLMIASGLFAYSDAHISGLRVGLAPVEDFSYPLAAVVLLPALWSLFGGRDDR
ncbi:lycopene cyclase domain-containing protein [Promicromonospora iranensis]|uniref:Lycopene cyclase domain-containing protein n=1 Tax=Promicromonospora iranensis TaxID=1105144 RepID=A0ABU2CTS4_9MICO|nr:lycopene cyclase domain-containing protein [Promicromonospora iranensis]MDR7384732.1 lycopene cyclase domain-containing protein [Promicromonospora iranensis]